MRTTIIKILFVFFLAIIYLSILTPKAYAIFDPLSVPNNKFGIHIISATPNEASAAADLVNSNGGDWGYVTVIIESGDRNHDKWQSFFNYLRDKHLIPIVRLATSADNSYWKRPYDGEEEAWADFLNNLDWPIKNRYVIVYNEPNNGQEWGGQVDPASYATVLNKTIDALKKRSSNFFVMNAGFDAAAPTQMPNYMDEAQFLSEMNKAVPGIFNKLDGWVSHSYPKNFIGSPDASGRNSLRTYQWELTYLKSLDLNKNLPVFITETGWEHDEGLTNNSSFPLASQVGDYFKEAFTNVWNDSRIVAITPFLLDYQASPFDHFSFEKPNGEEQNPKILGASYPPFYDDYYAIQNLSKISGKPIQSFKAQIIKGSIYPSLVAGEHYKIDLQFKNTGNASWISSNDIKLSLTGNKSPLGIASVSLPANTQVDPGDSATFTIMIDAPGAGSYNISLQLFHNNIPFDSSPINFKTEIKDPVSLVVNTSLKWKKDPEGEYTLTIISDVVKTILNIHLAPSGLSNPLEARYLLPDYPFRFVLSKPYYKDEEIDYIPHSGINELNFPPMEPNLFSAILHPFTLWKLLPFSG